MIRCSLLIRCQKLGHQASRINSSFNIGACDRVPNHFYISPALKCSSRTFSSTNVASDSSMCETIMAVSEPTFYSQGLGLANGMPSGVLQALLEQVHLTFDMPWYLTIMSTTVIMRICVLPLVIEARKASVRQANCTPQMNEFLKVYWICFYYFLPKSLWKKIDFLKALFSQKLWYQMYPYM